MARARASNAPSRRSMRGPTCRRSANRTVAGRGRSPPMPGIAACRAALRPATGRARNAPAPRLPRETPPRRRRAAHRCVLRGSRRGSPTRARPRADRRPQLDDQVLVAPDRNEEAAGIGNALDDPCRVAAAQAGALEAGVRIEIGRLHRGRLAHSPGYRQGASPATRRYRALLPSSSIGRSYRVIATLRERRPVPSSIQHRRSAAPSLRILCPNGHLGFAPTKTGSFRIGWRPSRT